MTGSQVLTLLKRAYDEFSEDKAMRLAAALACYTILSLAPLVVITMKVTTWTLRDEAKSGQVQAQMTQLVGPAGAQAISDMIASDKTNNSGVFATILSLAILLFSASGVFAELQDSMNTVWEVKPRPDMSWWDLIKKRFLSMGMVFGIIFLLLVSMFVTSTLSVALDKVVGGGDDNAGFLAKAAAFVADFVITVLVVGVLFTMIFKYLPDVKIRFRDVWLGGLLTAVLFKFGQYGLAAYFKYGSTTSAYGAAGSLVAVLLWAYYSACILLFGAEFTQVSAKMFGARIEPDKDAVPVTDEERAQHGMPRQRDVQESADAVAQGAGHHGGIAAADVCAPHTVTITRPAPGAGKAYAIAGFGVAAGLAMAAAGLLNGRKYMRGGLESMHLRDRLKRLESRVGYGRQLDLHARAMRVNDRLKAIDAKLRQPSWFDRLSAYVTKS